jgi:3-hydroxyacyl-CoA dehydrogenase
MTEEILEKVKKAGMIGASIDMMLAVIDIDITKTDFQALLNNAESDVAKAYNKGKMQYEFNKQTQLAKKAMTGDIAAMKELENIQRKQRFK